MVIVRAGAAAAGAAAVTRASAVAAQRRRSPSVMVQATYPGRAPCGPSRRPPRAGDGPIRWRSRVEDRSRNRPLTLLLAAWLLCGVGSWALIIALAVHAYDVSGASSVAAVAAARLFPAAFAAPFTGRVVDRTDRATAVVWASLAQAASMAAMAALIASGASLARDRRAGSAGQRDRDRPSPGDAGAAAGPVTHAVGAHRCHRGLGCAGQRRVSGRQRPGGLGGRRIRAVVGRGRRRGLPGGHRRPGHPDPAPRAAVGASREKRRPPGASWPTSSRACGR